MDRFNFEYCHVITIDILFTVGLVGLEQSDSQLVRYRTNQKKFWHISQSTKGDNNTLPPCKGAWIELNDNRSHFQRNLLTSSKVGVEKEIFVNIPILHNRQYENILYYNKCYTLWWLLDPYKLMHISLLFLCHFVFLSNSDKFLFVKVSFSE